MTLEERHSTYRLWVKESMIPPIGALISSMWYGSDLWTDDNVIVLDYFVGEVVEKVKVKILDVYNNNHQVIELSRTALHYDNIHDEWHIQY